MRWLLVISALVWSAQARAVDVQSQILVQASPLAGFQYYDGKSVWGELHEGDTLILVREPENAYDGNAVRVEWHGHKLGYVPRRDNAAVARMLDRAEPLNAKITRLLKTRNPWQRLLFEVYLPLQ
ncbi:HIRAN domain-containing protein [Sulfuriferula nivalis]|uniref:HIRAN domain-containing protein n=1 Tax=Sulfuriferula nivalis TaxID=2675298 RepID=A0A809RF47_9PROT|nr:HIRAN domain-containing protein [Sulfuriferula nivalis]BBP00439.1 HIRAN domain-containing protein [Sulfuriferula nivalis]